MYLPTLISNISNTNKITKQRHRTGRTGHGRNSVPIGINIWLNTGWWYTYPSEKWWSSSVEVMTFPTYGQSYSKYSKPPRSIWLNMTSLAGVNPSQASWDHPMTVSFGTNQVWATVRSMLHPQESLFSRILKVYPLGNQQLASEHGP